MLPKRVFADVITVMDFKIRDLLEPPVRASPSTQALTNRGWRWGRVGNQENPNLEKDSVGVTVRVRNATQAAHGPREQGAQS